MADLDHECAVLCRYLIDAEPPPTVRAGYRAAHAAGTVGTGHGRFERLLVRVAGHGGWMARGADAHARVFAQGGLLRRKLVLLVALLEVDASTFERIDAVDSSSLAGLVARSGLRALAFAVLVVGGLVFFLPARLACALLGSDGGRAA